MLALALFVVGWGTNVSTPFLVLYKERLGLTTSATVTIFVVYVLGIIGALLLAGPLSDRYGRRPLFLPFLALSGVASLVLVVGRDSFELLLFGRLLLGMVSGVVLAVGSAWMLEVVGKGNEAIAALGTTVISFLGFGFGPMLSAIYEQFFAAPLVVPFLLHFAATVLVLPLVARIGETHAAQPSQRIRVELGVPPESRDVFFKVIVPTAIWVFAFPSTAFALFPVLLSDTLGGSDVLIAGACGTLTSWASLLARPLIGQVGTARVLPTGMLSGIAGYLFGTIAFATGAWAFVMPAAIGAGLGSALLTSGCLTRVGEIASDATRGKLTSTFYLLAYPGMTMPLLITTAGEAWSIEGALLVATALATAVMVWSAMVNRPAV